MLPLGSCGDDKDKEIKNPASELAGTYFGTGQLTVAGSSLSLETYNGMKIRVTRSSDEYVIVEPYLASNDPFFKNGGSTVFHITVTQKGDYLLTSEEASRAQLTITKKGHMEYTYPYVTVGGESGYSLVFSGDRDKSLY